MQSINGQTKGCPDFAVIVQEADPVKYNFIKIPFEDSWGILMKKTDSLTEKPYMQMKDLISLPLICSRQSLSDEMPKWFGENLDKLNIIATYNLLYNASIMVKEGLGYALAFDNIIYADNDSELCFHPLMPILRSPIYLILKFLLWYCNITYKVLRYLNTYILLR